MVRSITVSDYLDKYFDVTYEELSTFQKEVLEYSPNNDIAKNFIDANKDRIFDLRKFEELDRDEHIILEVDDHSSLEDKILFFLKLLECNILLATCDLNDVEMINRGRNRTLPALYSLSKYYSPNFSFEEFVITYVYCTLAFIPSYNNFSTFICPDINQLVVTYRHSNYMIVNLNYFKSFNILLQKEMSNAFRHLFTSLDFKLNELLPIYLVKHYYSHIDFSKENMKKIWTLILERADSLESFMIYT